MPTIVRYERIEGLGIFLISALVYWALGFNLLWFVLLLLAADLFMAGYLINNKIGALVYNIGHSYLLPSLLLAWGVIAASDTAVRLALIWLGHIGLDRALGYGLKLESGFKDTHLGRIGGR
ncbi:MAG: DUF4260 domain-containing protein [Patescibacteria group bacterium]